MKKLIIAEKPSVAADLAKVLGDFKKKEDYYEGDNLVISSAVGHIVELFMPDDIDKKLKWWSLNTLPILPDKFKLKPVEKTKDRLNLLKKLMDREDIGELINACDAGREGELIFAYIYEAARSKKPIKRMWMSSMTPESIKEAFNHLKKNEELAGLQDAARCRSESDWLIGINGTRAITSRMFGARSRQIATIGRVQTPTLALVCEREREINNFVARDYWRIKGEFKVKEGAYEGYYQKEAFKKGDDEDDRADRIWDKSEADFVMKAIDGVGEASVSEVKKRSKQIAPVLYDLTTLQREANSRFGMPAGMTLKIAQSLYEKHKVITYPRTDSKALPEDYGHTVEKTLDSMSGEYREYAKKVIKEDWIDIRNKRIFNNKKVSDHFAIIPTGEVPKKLSPEELKIYDMIAKRFIAAFYPAAEYDVTTRISRIVKYDFKTEGKVLVVPGWLEVYGKDSDGKDNLPPLIEADGTPPKAKVKKVDLEAEETKPPARYTEATLLGAMEHAGRFVEDEDLAEAMKGKGLGTPATRAQIIEHLIHEKYMEREQRELKPTIKAENLVEFLKALKIDFLTSPAMTGEWEYQLHEIEEGRLTREAFMKGIKDVTCQIVAQTKEFDEGQIDSKETDIVSPTDGKKFMETFRSYRSQDGKMVIYKTMGNRRLTEEEIKELVKERKLGPLDGFKSKAGKPFSAMLKVDEEFKVKFEFGDAGVEGEAIDKDNYAVVSPCPMAKKGLCSHSDAKVYATPGAYQCEHHKEEGTKCTFRVNRTLLSRAIPEDQFLKMVETGKTDLLDKFKSNRTKRFFSAHLILKDDGGIGFEFAPKAEKTLKEKKETKKKPAKAAGKSVKPAARKTKKAVSDEE